MQAFLFFFYNYLKEKIKYLCCKRFFLRSVFVESVVDDDEDVFSLISDVSRWRLGRIGINFISFGLFISVEKGVNSDGEDFVFNVRCFLEHQYI